MPRRPRLYVAGGFYHAILRGNGRQATFFGQEDRDQWQCILQEGSGRYQHRLHNYSWMTNHVHMAIKVGVEPLTRFMRYFGQSLHPLSQSTGHSCATVTEVARRFGRAQSGLSRSINRLRDKVNK